MTINSPEYKRFCETCLTIINKDSKEVPFYLNDAQDSFLRLITGRDVILKARQLGFSSLILALGTTQFILKKNQRCVCISHETDATQRLLDRVKFYIGSYERYLSKKVGKEIRIPMKYNSRNEIFNTESNSSFYIGTAGAKNFGRGDTITFLHLSEFAYYDDPESMIMGVMQAVVPNGFVFIETTANGFNYFKDFWERSVLGETGFKHHFYDPTWEYGVEFLDHKKLELKEKYLQEYPMTPTEAFIASGENYFDREALQWYLKQVRSPLTKGVIYV